MREYKHAITALKRGVPKFGRKGRPKLPQCEVLDVESEVELRPSPKLVGDKFVSQYYSILHHTPQILHSFYQNGSNTSHPETQCAIDPITMQTIRDKTQSECNEILVEIKTVDAQESLGGGILLVVTGLLAGRDCIQRKFNHSIVLARQQNGYYVFNDIFVFVEDSYPVMPQEDIVEEMEEEAYTVTECNVSIDESLMDGITIEGKAPEVEVAPTNLCQAVSEDSHIKSSTFIFRAKKESDAPSSATVSAAVEHSESMVSLTPAPEDPLQQQNIFEEEVKEEEGEINEGEEDAIEHVTHEVLFVKEEISVVEVAEEAPNALSAEVSFPSTTPEDTIQEQSIFEGAAEKAEGEVDEDEEEAETHLSHEVLIMKDEVPPETEEAPCALISEVDEENISAPAVPSSANANTSEIKEEEDQDEVQIQYYEEEVQKDENAKEEMKEAADKYVATWNESLHTWDGYVATWNESLHTWDGYAAMGHSYIDHPRPQARGNIEERDLAPRNDSYNNGGGSVLGKSPDMDMLEFRGIGSRGGIGRNSGRGMDRASNGGYPQPKKKPLPVGRFR